MHNGFDGSSNQRKISKKPAKYIKTTNNVLKQLHKNAEVCLQFPKLKLNSLKVSVYYEPRTKAMTKNLLSWDVTYFYPVILTTFSLYFGNRINQNE